jgi:hypothetical protein
MLNISDPALPQQPPHREPLEAYSEAPADAQNRAAQANNVAAHHAELAQDVNAKARGASNKRVDDASLAKLIAEENASRTKFPRYPGLERWELIEKMGDGAFSNVYRARDLQGDAGEVAIKVVRKYEMNSMQVSVTTKMSVYTSLICFVSVFISQCSFLPNACTLLSIARVTLRFISTGYQHLRVCALYREINIYIRNSKRLRKQQRCGLFFFFFFFVSTFTLRSNTPHMLLVLLVSMFLGGLVMCHMKLK